MKLIFQFIKPHKKLFIATVILLIVDVVGALFIPTLAAEMLNMGTSNSSFTELWHTGVQMGIVSVISGICAISGGYACAVLAARVCEDLRVAIYEKPLKLSVYDFRQFGIASITTRTVSDINTIQIALISAIQMILPVPFVCIVALVLCFRLDVNLGFTLLAVTVVILIIAALIMKSAALLFRKLQKLLDRMSTVLLENLTGVRVVRAFNNEQREDNRMTTAFGNYAKTSIKANRLFANLDGLSFFFVNLFVVIVYRFSGTEIYADNLQIGDITAVIEYALFIMFFLMMAQMVIITLPRALECCSRIQEVLTHTPQIQDMVEEDPHTSEKEPHDVLAFKNVSFRFADAEEDTLHHLDFTCKRGKTTAIIGGTGSGKSTVASLILRFHDVTGGKVCLNGVDIRDMTQRYLRDHIAYVQQKAWLFSGTIASNLRYSNANATEEELMHAIDVAQAGDFVRSLPEGFNALWPRAAPTFQAARNSVFPLPEPW